MKVLVTGAAGFLGGYLIEELLAHGYEVVGLDNYSKYGKVEKSYDSHPNYRFVEGDAQDVPLLKELIADCDHFVALAALIGGIPFFHTYAYDLIAGNERIIASSFDAALWAHQNQKLNKITVISSSMVFENTSVYPTPEGEQFRCPPPSSTYGFQKLACEYFAKGAWEQYQLPYTIIRPFNLIGIGEKRAKSDKEITSGNIKLAIIIDLECGIVHIVIIGYPKLLRCRFNVQATLWICSPNTEETTGKIEFIIRCNTEGDIVSITSFNFDSSGCTILAPYVKQFFGSRLPDSDVATILDFYTVSTIVV